MSTRCNIVIKKDDTCTYLYHHCDGYPSGVGAELERFFENNATVGMTPIGVYNSLVFLYGDEYELCEGIHGDISYLYEICLDDSCVILSCRDSQRNLVYEVHYDLAKKPVDTTEPEPVEKTYTKGDLKDMRVRFCCDFELLIGDSRLYAECPYEVQLDKNRLLKMLMDTFAFDIVKHTKIEIKNRYGKTDLD